ncbi:MAG: hypothetical protein AAF346_04610 [Pseudomonadota bacterium]
MRKPTAAGITLSLGAAAFLAVSASQSAAQELSERSVKTIMNYAWSYTPDKFTPPSGKTVFIDKKNRDKMTIPVDKGREVIKVARLTAHAQICDLREDQVKNYRSLMLREQKSDKWTPQQMVYINQLHLTTVMMLVGKLQIVKNKGDGDKKVVVKDGKAAAKTCTEEQRKKVKELITTYVSTGPALASAAGKAVKRQ